MFGLSREFTASVFLLATLGAADTVSMILRHTIRQYSTPDHLRGRMTSVIMIFSESRPQLGNLEAGIVASLLGAPFFVVTGGLATVIMVGWVALRAPIVRMY